MPVFTAIGTALGFTAAAAGATTAAVVTSGAFLAGVTATAVVGSAAIQYGASQGAAAASKAPQVSGFDSRISPAADAAVAGRITEAEAKTAVKKRAFRSGVLFTSPTGLDSDSQVASAKLK